jgi:hypothetical protein
MELVVHATTKVPSSLKKNIIPGIQILEDTMDGTRSTHGRY